MSATPVPLSDKLSELVQQAIRDQLLKNDPAPKAPVEIAPPVVESAPATPVVVKSGQKKASEIVGVELGALDFAVTILDPKTVPVEIRSLIPDINPLYKPDVVALSMLLRAMEDNDPTLMTGPTGCGKSELARHVAAVTNRPFIRVNMTGDAESSVIFGQMTAESGSTKFVDGPVTEACKYGALLVVDEWDVAPPEISMGFQWMLENGGKLFLKEMPGTAKDKTLAPHPNFRIVMCGNTVGQGDDTGAFAGTNVQNTAMLDRFQTTIKMDYMNPEDERKMLRHAVKGLADASARKMVQFANLIRTQYKQNSINLTVSPRTLVNWGYKTLAWGDVKKALEVAYFNKLRDTERKVAMELYNKVYGN